MYSEHGLEPLKLTSNLGGNCEVQSLLLPRSPVCRQESTSDSLQLLFITSYSGWLYNRAFILQGRPSVGINPLDLKFSPFRSGRYETLIILKHDKSLH